MTPCIRNMITQENAYIIACSKLHESSHLNNYIKVFHKLLFSINQFADVPLSLQLRI